jgi:hypothetical protein
MAAFTDEAGPRRRGCNQVDDRLVADQGVPRQFWEMKLNSRCSILFHLLVPGRK